MIFDCDGVLVDSERLAVRVESRLLTALGWPIGEDEVLDRFVGRSDAWMLAEIERELGRPVPEWTERYEADLFAAFRDELVAVDGVVSAIDALEAVRVGCAVLGLEEIVSFVHPANTRSLAVTARLGMVEEAEVPHPTRDEMLRIMRLTCSSS